MKPDSSHGESTNTYKYRQNIIYNWVKVKGKVHPRTGHEGPKGE